MRAYLDGRTKKKPAILTSRALIGFPISYEAIGVDHAEVRLSDSEETLPTKKKQL